MNNASRRIAVVGMGYVGIPVAALFAESGLHVTGLDVDEAKVASLRQGKYPIRGNEPDLPELISAMVEGGRFEATTDATALAQADAILVCVQTPFDVAAGEPRYDALRSALTSVGANMKAGTLVVVESTIAPGTMDGLARPVLEEASGMQVGKDFMLGHCPERVMPGRLLRNLREYARVMGAEDEATHEAMHALYSRIVQGRLGRLRLREAEVVKTFENTYRDVEIALANEFSQYCDVLGVDLFRVRDEVNRVVDRNLHLPGAGVGGHCIPKDTHLLAYGTKGRFTPELMLLARRINDGMPSVMFEKVKQGLEANGVPVEGARVGVLGLSYLGDSDDVRNTPTAVFVSLLREAGAEVTVHDPLADAVDGVEPVRELEAAVHGADAVAVFTAHSEYRDLRPEDLAKSVRHRVLVDGRRVFRREDAEKAGFWFSGVGH